MLTLVLVAALCTNEGDRICSYMDVTRQLHVTTDAECRQAALMANRHNVSTGQDPRYDCVAPAQYLALLGEKPPAEPAETRRAM